MGKKKNKNKNKNKKKNKNNKKLLKYVGRLFIFL